MEKIGEKLMKAHVTRNSEYIMIQRSTMAIQGIVVACITTKKIIFNPHFNCMNIFIILYDLLLIIFIILLFDQEL